MRVGITAGPTREYLDPVRFLSNASTGRMGYVLAKVFRDKGHKVHLISGPVCLAPLQGCVMTFIETAQDMFEAVMRVLLELDLFIMAAAVSDYTLKREKHKIKKSEAKRTLSLFRTKDILREVSKISHKAFVVGFSAESENCLQNSRFKLKEKQLDMIIANEIGSENAFASQSNAGHLLFSRDKNCDFEIKKCSKLVFAQKIFQVICDEIKLKMVE